jgi:hypothetical protein
MKGAGINNTHKFILKETSPILEIRGGSVEESDKKLVQGTIVDGMLKTRVVKVGKEKRPYRFIEIKNKKGYLSPSVVNLYVGNFANLEGEGSDSNSDVKSTAFGEKSSRGKKAKDVFINWGLPVIGGVVGYQIAKKMGADEKKTIGFVLFFGLLGVIPRYLYNK